MSVRGFECVMLKLKREKVGSGNKKFCTKKNNHNKRERKKRKRKERKEKREREKKGGIFWYKRIGQRGL